MFGSFCVESGKGKKTAKKTVSTYLGGIGPGVKSGPAKVWKGGWIMFRKRKFSQSLKKTDKLSGKGDRYGRGRGALKGLASKSFLKGKHCYTTEGSNRVWSMCGVSVTEKKTTFRNRPKGRSCCSLGTGGGLGQVGRRGCGTGSNARAGLGKVNEREK